MFPGIDRLAEGNSSFVKALKRGPTGTDREPYLRGDFRWYPQRRPSEVSRGQSESGTFATDRPGDIGRSTPARYIILRVM
jgi:hypothetical protein